MTARSDLSRSEGKSEGLSESGKTSDTLDVEGVLRNHVPYARLGQTDCHGCDWSSADGTPHAAHVAAVLREQIVEWLGNEALTVFSASPVEVAYRKGWNAILTALAAQVAPPRVPSTSEGD